MQYNIFFWFDYTQWFLKNCQVHYHIDNNYQIFCYKYQDYYLYHLNDSNNPLL